MKRKSVPLLKIGLFVLVGFIILIVFIFYLGSKEKMFSSTSHIKARFSTVSNLRKGAEIDMVGINVGSVIDIDLPRNASDSVTVTMKVLTDALKLIHTDSKAIITTQGLIGDKVIYISMGGDSTQPVTPESTIYGVTPQDFSKIYDTLSAAVSQLDSLATEATMLVHGIRSGNGTLGKLINDDQLYRNINGMAAEAKQTMTDARVAVGKMSAGVDKVTTTTNDVVDRINRGEGSLGKLLHDDYLYENVRKTSDNLASSSYELHDALAKIALGGGRFAEVMEGFKHNFLVKGYFEDRGYWDAPEFEMTIDRKIDSLNKLRQLIHEQAQHSK
jgi:phospholipid/cholesterol/gamma-HCH transport system substrate-binding protein